MKSTNIQINYDEEKIDALNVFLNERGKTLDEELIAMIDNLDEKTIPQKVQLFLEKRNSGKAENKHVWEQADSSRKRTEPNYQAKTEKKDGGHKAPSSILGLVIIDIFLNLRYHTRKYGFIGFNGSANCFNTTIFSSETVF